MVCKEVKFGDLGGQINAPPRNCSFGYKVAFLLKYVYGPSYAVAFAEEHPV
jgi:hypothetical protein